MKNRIVSISILLLAAAAVALAWIGVDFSPGFSEGLTAVFLTAGAIPLLLLQKERGRVLVLTGALCVPVGTYIYAAGEDHLGACVIIALFGTALCFAALFVLFRKKKERPVEHIVRFALLYAGLFTLLCGIFSTALLPVGFGVLICFAARYTERAMPWMTLAGLFLCDLFLLAPMCFGGAL